MYTVGGHLSGVTSTTWIDRTMFYLSDRPVSGEGLMGSSPPKEISASSPHLPQQSRETVSSLSQKKVRPLAEAQSHRAKTGKYIEYKLRHEPVAARTWIGKIPIATNLHVHLGGALKAHQMVCLAERHNRYFDTERLRFYKERSETSVEASTMKVAGYALSRLEEAIGLHTTAKKASRPNNQYKFFKQVFPVFDSLLCSGVLLEEAVEIYLEGVVQDCPSLSYIELMHEGSVTCPDSFIDSPREEELAKRLKAVDYSLLKSTLEDSDLSMAEVRSRWHQSGKPHQALLAEIRDYLEERLAQFTALAHDYEPLQERIREYNQCDHYFAKNGEPPLSDVTRSITVRFLRELDRETPLVGFLWNSLCAYWLIQNTKIVSGLSPVGPEYTPSACDHFRFQMVVLRFIKEKMQRRRCYSIHAGEVPKEKEPLRDRLLETLLALPDRIGHGFSLDGETQIEAYYKELKERSIIIEVLPTSSQQLSGYLPKNHPIDHWRTRGIKTTPGTDDDGCFCNTIKGEVVKLMTEYGQPYGYIVEMLRNGLMGAFACDEPEHFYKRSSKDGLIILQQPYSNAIYGSRPQSEAWWKQRVAERPWLSKVRALEEALRSLEKEANAEFDKELVDGFIRLFETSFFQEGSNPSPRYSHKSWITLDQAEEWHLSTVQQAESQPSSPGQFFTSMQSATAIHREVTTSEGASLVLNGSGVRWYEEGHSSLYAQVAAKSSPSLWLIGDLFAFSLQDSNRGLPYPEQIKQFVEKFQKTYGVGIEVITHRADWSHIRKQVQKTIQHQQKQGQQEPEGI